MIHIKHTLIITFCILAWSACKRQQPAPASPETENELITTVRLHFADSSTNDTLTFNWRQPAGPGTLITVDTIRLVPGKVYKGWVEIFDESKSPVFNVTTEIKTLQNEHRFYYTSSTSRLEMQITDADTEVPPLEVGLSYRAVTGASGNEAGTLRMVLRHYTASSPKTGGATAGSADIDVTFPLLVR